MTTSQVSWKVVPPRGPLNSRIMYIGEAPGKEEDRPSTEAERMPFVGASGQMWTRAMAAAGLDRNAARIDNCFSRRPHGNKVEHYFADLKKFVLNDEGRREVARLKEEIESWRDVVSDPKEFRFLVAVGGTALRLLTGKKRITRWRGSMIPCTLVPGLYVYATYHPSYIQRKMSSRDTLFGEKKKTLQNDFAVFLMDFQRIRSWLDEERFVEPEEHYDVELGFDELMQRIATLHREHEVAVDIETLPSNEGPLLWMIGFASSAEEAFTVPFIANGKPKWPLEYEATLHEAISEVFLNPKVRKVTQGGQYDMAILGKYYGYRFADDSWEDTMWSHQAARPYMKKDLGTLVSIYLKRNYFKDQGGSWGVNAKSDLGEALYNCRDTTATRELMPILEAQGRELNTHAGYRRQMEVLPSMVAMTIRGVRINKKRMEELHVEFDSRCKEIVAEIEEDSGFKELNLKSNPQKQSLLYGYYGLEVQRNPKTKQISTDKDSLHKLKRKYPDARVLDLLLEYSKLITLRNNFTQLDVDGDRLHSSYSFISTHRLSSSGSPFVFRVLDNGKLADAKGNLQNLPARTEEGREIRKFFVPDEGRAWTPSEVRLMEMLLGPIPEALRFGKIWAASDLIQAEAQVVALLAKDHKRLELFATPGSDVHWANAKGVFDIPAEVSYDKGATFADAYTNAEHTLKDLRNIGKTIEHASNYGMGPMMVQTILLRQGFYLPSNVCQTLLRRCMAMKPAVLEYQRSVRAQLAEKMYLVSPLGRVRHFVGRQDEAMNRTGYAQNPQSTVGELLTIGINELERTHAETFQSLLNIHDEVAGQCWPCDLPKAIPAIRSALERELEWEGLKLTIGCDFKVGLSWGDAKEFKYEELAETFSKWEAENGNS